MSIRVMSAVWDHGPKDQGELLVLLALADFADDAGMCWPSVRRVAEKARITERGAQKIMRRLEEAGHLRREPNAGKSGTNRYIITPNTVHPEHGSPRTVVHHPPEHGSPPPLNSGSPEPSVRTINEPSIVCHDGFDAFWEDAPRKKGKGAARTAYLKALRKTDAATLLNAMRAYATERRGKDEQYTVHPATWLNQERWTDEPARPVNDFHDKIDAMLNGSPDDLRRTIEDYSLAGEQVPERLEAARAPDGRNGDDENAGDGGSYQQAASSLIKPRRIGAGMF